MNNKLQMSRVRTPRILSYISLLSIVYCHCYRIVYCLFICCHLLLIIIRIIVYCVLCIMYCLCTIIIIIIVIVYYCWSYAIRGIIIGVIYTFGVILFGVIYYSGYNVYVYAYVYIYIYRMCVFI